MKRGKYLALAVAAFIIIFGLAGRTNAPTKSDLSATVVNGVNGDVIGGNSVPDATGAVTGPSAAGISNAPMPVKNNVAENFRSVPIKFKVAPGVNDYKISLKNAEFIGEFSINSDTKVAPNGVNVTRVGDRVTVELTSSFLNEYGLQIGKQYNAEIYSFKDGIKSESPATVSFSTQRENIFFRIIDGVTDFFRNFVALFSRKSGGLGSSK